MKKIAYFCLVTTLGAWAGQAKFTLDYVKRGSLYRGKALTYFTCQRSEKDKRELGFVVCGQLDKKEIQDQNLSGKELKGILANLAQFESVQFDKSDLSFSLLSDSSFHASSFVNAQMAGAHLDNSIFKDVDFQSANLCGASLMGADLQNSKNLEEANLVGAIFDSETKLPFPVWKAKKLGMHFVKDKNKGIAQFTYRNVDEACESSQRTVASDEVEI